MTELRNMLLWALVFVVQVLAEEKEKPTIEAQLDPSIYLRAGGDSMRPSMGLYPQQQAGMMMPSSFSFNCRCTSRTPNANAPPPIDANQMAQQQIIQLQEQVRRQQEIINRQAANRNGGVETLAQLLQAAQSLDCTCSSDPSSTSGNLYGSNANTLGVGNGLNNGFGQNGAGQVGLNSQFGTLGNSPSGLGGGSSMMGMQGFPNSGAFGFPGQLRGLPLASFDNQLRPLVEVPYASRFH
ncbi:unnamed protein product [Caenorhabditis auriculariae]|uniref:Uncharacterized protein n=1 Tax=Caenorhabditis auriculariae TaxID=2777116 RepID=A0A8S1HSM8_9PELO|nr:unnamed protein product [Caenorhabditis auriculariae]